MRIFNFRESKLRKIVDRDVVGDVLIDKMTSAWGKNLECFNISEKLWLVRAVIGDMVDGQNDLDPAICEAQDALIFAEESYKIEIVYALTRYLIITEHKPLDFYIGGDWARDAMETWGDCLEDISINDGFILIFNILTDLINFDDLFQVEEMESCLELLKGYFRPIRIEIIVAIAELAYDQYFS